jgi:uncharacterized protein (TIGR03437 family)
VTNHGAVSASFTAQLQPAAPGLFQWGATDYAEVTRFPDNALIGNPCAVPGTVAAKPGEFLTLWVTELGPTQPPAAAGKVVTASAPTASPVTLAVGNTGVNVIGAAVTIWDPSACIRSQSSFPTQLVWATRRLWPESADSSPQPGVNLYIANP